MPSEFHYTRMVEFSDTDMAGIMHFSKYFQFMEAAEHGFVRSLGLSVVDKRDPSLPPLVPGQEKGVEVGWPRVAVNCEYKRPLKFEDVVDVHLKVTQKSEKAITYSFSFRKQGEKEECARGSVTVVCVTMRQGRMQATFIPKEFGDKIEVSK